MQEARNSAERFVAGIRAALPQRLESVVLHGSVARGEAVPRVSDINLMVVLDRVDAAALQAISPLAVRWVRAGNTPPLLLGWEEWQRAADVFAIELSDMKEAYHLLHGRDPLVDLKVEPRHLRLQAERELRAKLLHLREGMLLAADRPEGIGQLLLRALPSFTTYLRAVLRLAGQVPPPSTDEVVRRAAALVGAAPEPLLHCWQARLRGQKTKLRIDDPVTVGYCALAEGAAAFVDAIPSTGGEA